MAPPPFSIFTWNVSFRPATCLAPLADLIARKEIVCLQGVLPRFWPEFERELLNLGFRHALFSGTEHTYGCIIANRCGMEPGETKLLDRPQRLAHAAVGVRGWSRPLQVMSAVAPLDPTQDDGGAHAFADLRAAIAAMKSNPLVVTGGFTDPRSHARDDRDIRGLFETEDLTHAYWAAEDFTFDKRNEARESDPTCDQIFVSQKVNVFGCDPVATRIPELHDCSALTATLYY